MARFLILPFHHPYSLRCPSILQVVPMHQASHFHKLTYFVYWISFGFKPVCCKFIRVYFEPSLQICAWSSWFYWLVSLDSSACDMVFFPFASASTSFGRHLARSFERFQSNASPDQSVFWITDINLKICGLDQSWHSFCSWQLGCHFYSSEIPSQFQMIINLKLLSNRKSFNSI